MSDEDELKRKAYDMFLEVFFDKFQVEYKDKTFKRVKKQRDKLGKNKNK